MTPERDWSHEAPVPYVDGLCFMSPDEDIAESGLTAFICDVSTGELRNGRDEVVTEEDVARMATMTPEDRGQLAPEDMALRMVRTFTACAKATAAARRQLGSGGKAFLATKGEHVTDAFASGRTAVVLQFQGCDPIESDLDRMTVFYELGVRILQITHHGDNAFGGGCMEPVQSGLTPLGFDGIARMNELGIIPDLAHAAEPMAMDVLRTSTRPVVISHTGPQALVDNARCASDKVLRAVADSGGIAGLFMMSFWVTSEDDPTIDAWVRSLRHMVDVAGIDHVGVANDFSLRGEVGALAVDNDNAQAIQGYYPWWDQQAAHGVHGFEKRPTHVVFPELNNVRRMFLIHDALLEAGFSDTDAAKIMGGNWLRVLAEELR